jgi:hypothetical protein
MEFADLEDRFSKRAFCEGAGDKFLAFHAPVTEGYSFELLRVIFLLEARKIHGGIPFQAS